MMSMKFLYILFLTADIEKPGNADTDKVNDDTNMPLLAFAGKKFLRYFSSTSSVYLSQTCFNYSGNRIYSVAVYTSSVIFDRRL